MFYMQARTRERDLERSTSQLVLSTSNVLVTPEDTSKKRTYSQSSSTTRITKKTADIPHGNEFCLL